MTNTSFTPDDNGAEPTSEGFWSNIRFAIKAIEIRLRFVAILVAIGVVIGCWDSIQNIWDKWTRPAPSSVATLAAGEEFYCPMHPSVVRDSADPGGADPHCPICGMPLSKRKKGAAAPLPEGVLSRVQLSPYRIQLAGIQTAEITHQPLALNIRALGLVAVDERGLSRIVVRAAGYVEKLYVKESFAMVYEGDPLADIYSPDLYLAAQELLFSARDKNAKLIAVGREKLKLLGVDDREIDALLTSGVATPKLLIRAPRGGHVFQKNIVEGDRVEAGQMLFEVADLSTVWIEGELYEQDAAALQPGQPVEATLDAYPGRVFPGKVSLVHPHVETSTRTLRVRCEIENPDHELRPGMFATLQIRTPMTSIEPFHSKFVAEQQLVEAATAGANLPLDHDKIQSLAELQKVCPVTGQKLGAMGEPVPTTAGGRVVLLCCPSCQEKVAARPDYYLERMRSVTDDGVLAVPETAVIDTGNAKVVYIEREPGVFEGVPVTLGPRSGNSYAVIDGLHAGDHVAAAGAFLVDAETRLNPAAATAFFGASGGPSGDGRSVSTMSNDAGGAPNSSTDETSAQRQANLAQLSDADRALAERQSVCPITGNVLGLMGVPFKMTANGETFFLCCESCRQKVLDDPKAALTKLHAGALKP